MFNLKLILFSDKILEIFLLNFFYGFSYLSFNYRYKIKVIYF